MCCCPSRRSAEAERLDGALTELHETLFLEGNPVPVKWALAKWVDIPRAEAAIGGTQLRYHVKVSNALAAAGIEIDLGV